MQLAVGFGVFPQQTLSDYDRMSTAWQYASTLTHYDGSRCSFLQNHSISRSTCDSPRESRIHQIFAIITSGLCSFNSLRSSTNLQRKALLLFIDLQRLSVSRNCSRPSCWGSGCSSSWYRPRVTRMRLAKYSIARRYNARTTRSYSSKISLSALTKSITLRVASKSRLITIPSSISRLAMLSLSSCAVRRTVL